MDNAMKIEGSSRLGRYCDYVITSLILASVAVVFASTFDLSPQTHKVLYVLECVASIVFTIEYAVRIATAESKIRYIFSPMAIVDLVAILPFWLPMLLPGTVLGIRALRLVRLTRIFKLNRYSDAMKSLGEVIALKRRELLCSVFFVGLLMLISSLLMYSAEHEAQPTVFRNAFSGLWWAVATLTTVGYGDIYPVTAFGRVIGTFIAFSGLAAVAIPTGIISSGLTERISKSELAKPKPEERDLAEIKAALREQDETLDAILAKLNG